jgi:hypothetical protein
MDNKVSILVALGVLACSMQALSTPPVIKQYEALIPKDSNGMPFARACYLGGDCLTLDSRPFEICHLAGKACDGKRPELLLVTQPALLAQPEKKAR